MPQTFDHPFHVVSDEYPESSSIVRLGRGYEFASKPRGPDQILFNLQFQHMYFMQTRSTGAIDASVAPQYNILVLQAFYEAHRLYEPFNYPHPTRGTVLVRFKKPLVMPKPLGAHYIGGIKTFPNHLAHATEGFDLQLVQQP